MAGKGRIVVNQEATEDDVFVLESGVECLELLEPPCDLPLWLNEVESPFNWLPTRFPEVLSKEVISKAMERIQMDEGFDATFPFEKFVRMLTLVYELSYHGEGERAWDQLIVSEQLIEEEKGNDVAMFTQLKEALTHTTLATKAHLLYRTGDIENAKQLAESIQPVGSMPTCGLAALLAMKARFFYHYRSRGVQLAVEYAKEALKLAPEEPLWQILTAEAIRRLRKFVPGTWLVSTEEVSLLESAVITRRNARHLVLLAQAYRERADAIFKQNRAEKDFFQSQTFSDISEMQAKAFDLYREALSLRQEDEVVNRLCGYGLLKLPAFKSDYRLAQRCLQKALELSPNNPTTIHALGIFYYKGLMDYEKAALFCEKAGKLGNFPASLDMLRMKRLVYGSSYDPVFDFGKLLQQYGDDSTKRHEVLCQMGSYALIFERDLSKALKYFNMLLKENAEPSIMSSHKCTFLNMACKINVFECIINEGARLLEEEGNFTDEIKEDLNVKDIVAFLNKLKTTQPELFEVPTKTNLIDELHKVSDEINQTYARKKERRDSAKERRRSSLSRHSSFNGSQPSSRHSSEEYCHYKSNENISETRSHKPPSSPNVRHTFEFSKIEPIREIFPPAFDRSKGLLKSEKDNSKYKSKHDKSDVKNKYRTDQDYIKNKHNPVYEKTSKQRYYRSNSYQTDSSAKYRGQSDSDRTLNSSDQKSEQSKHQFPGSIPRRNSETGKGKGRYWNETLGEKKPQFRRLESWSGSTSETENWRKKDDKNLVTNELGDKIKIQL